MELEKIFENADCERALVKIASGDAEALSVIHKYMSRQIYAVAYAVLQDFTLSDDVVQETYVKIIEKSFSYQKGTNARAWVLSIARNIAIDFYRKRRFECEADELADAGMRFDESTVLSSMEVKRALDALSDEERQIITFKVYAGLKHREIAALLGITVEACKKKYQRAADKLRDAL
ncbi:MAG: RNA polymerase sigma factor [Clostridia bacterium]|nr:RNA polymerase sigma factor [Clostridia bacterium]